VRTPAPQVSVGLATVLAVLALGVGVPVFSILTGPSGPFTASGSLDPSDGGQVPVIRVPAPIPAPSVGSSDPGPVGGPSPSGPISPGPTPPGRSPSPPGPTPSALSARYATIGGRGLLGVGNYQGQVIISNTGRVAVTGWTVVITLPSGATVSSASGAAYRQDGGTVTFTPTAATRSVPASGTVQFRFRVDAVFDGRPTGCSIDGHPCS